MQNHSITLLKKCDPFVTENRKLNRLLNIYWDQLHAMADAELAGLPEPMFVTPPLPKNLISKN
ncbi:hypothetical protein [Methylophilus sp. Leaf414]|uniref:hypothetical protein n=1 Tax=Methylophilus sp. Leaf414 TaxID=1736371 RepID=UPI0006FFDFA7|nr:hypothetical protein [Methylophilus sp. Leaf414]KQT33267.1 hypothetical protein ASG24_13330 [Methylophilus sp. Leaf414]